MNSDRMSLVSVIIAALLLPVAGTQAAVRYVALDGSGADGLSWATAYKTIQQAIDDPFMVGGGEIWVKQGVYYLNVSIEVDKSVRILGGYSGAGNTRDWQTYQTTIDGQRKAYHCFYVTGNATIDGFGITGGNPLGTLPNGAGVAVVDRTATISNCLFLNNRIGGSGAALATVTADNTKVMGCTFRANAAGTGGAIYNEGGAGLQITDCTFVKNSANDSGGAIHNLESGVTISTCLFQNGLADGEQGVAGAILNEESTATITNCVFTGNAASYGAGIFNFFSTVTIEGCLFTDCGTGTYAGGGMFSNGGSVKTNSCLFQRNVVVDVGGGLMTAGAASQTTNCILWANRAANGGGAIYIGAATGTGATANPQFINCTMYGNKSNVTGGAVYSEKTPSTFINCIIWGNSAPTFPGIYTETGWSSGTPAARYCDIQGDSAYPGTANIQLNPYWVDPNHGDFNLSFDSPCLDTGNNADVAGITKDYEDAPRVVDGDANGSVIVDKGAVELQTSSVHLARGEIIRGVSYDNLSDTSATFIFTLRLETDDTITSVQFLPPGNGTWRTIPSDSHKSVGNVETYHQVHGKTHVWGYWEGADNASALAAYADGTYRILVHYRNGAQGETDVVYAVPAPPTQKPMVTAPAYNATVGSPVTVRWEGCNDPSVNKIYLTITNSSSGEDVVGDLLDPAATVSNSHVLNVGTYEGEVGFANLADIRSTDNVTPFRCGKAVFTGIRFTVPYTAVYRFWAPATDQHFYTASEAEKDNLIKNFPDSWTFEGVAFNASATAGTSRMLPVYRFYSGKGHFYTINETEKNKLVNEYSRVWKLEGIAFYAFPEGAEPPECQAVYRFWNASNNTHFFTMSEAEASKLITTYSGVYTYEGVAFYAYPP